MGKKLSMVLVLALMIATATQYAAVFSTEAAAVQSDAIRLMVDGRDITEAAAPRIVNGRTLVPVRFVSEELGADVVWNNDDRTVSITKGSRSVLLRIDSRLVKYMDRDTVYNLCDVAPKIINDRTFVPLRLVGNALGVSVGWHDPSRTVYVDSSQPSGIMPFFDMTISSVASGQTIDGTTDLQSAFNGGIPSGTAEIKYILIDPDTARGFVVARGDQPSASYRWLPSAGDRGQKLLTAAVYDGAGNFLAGHTVPVNVSLNAKVSLMGVTDGQIVTDALSLGTALNFSAEYVKYEVTNLDTGKVFTTAESDPYGPYKWSPMMEDNGTLSIRPVAYDEYDQAYPGQAVLFELALPRKLALAGVSEGQTIARPVTLSASRNFQVSGTEYYMRDPLSGTETLLAKVGYVSYKWFPAPSLIGARELYVRVYDTAGNPYTSGPVHVSLTGTPKLLVEGVGPGQVVTGEMKLKGSSNVALQSISYILTNTVTGVQKAIAGGIDPLAEYSYMPVYSDAGACTVKAVGTYGNGSRITSEEIALRIYMDKIYPAVPVTEKSQFMGLASGLARDSQENTGMSAALQTAQAILETGWGQSVPVDKYTGQLSYNLFGIKGSGSAGSVTSNTWEEYNGVSYRIDAEFRAYYGVAESWNDHKKLLLTASRYEPFRQVMNDSTQGAWALRRCGYATDSKYPLKLIDIISLYDLRKLDEVGI